MSETKTYLHNLDINRNKIENPLLNPISSLQRNALASVLTVADEGYVCFDIGDNKQYFWDGTTWITSLTSLPWGTITGTITDQTDLITYLSGEYYPLTNPAGYITSADLSPYLTSSAAATIYEPIISSGTIFQYWSGNKTWQTLPIYTLASLGGVPTTRQLTINGITHDLSADRSWTISTYTLPIATSSILGGVKIGTGVNVAVDGTISVSTNYQSPLSGNGYVYISGSTISYDTSVLSNVTLTSLTTNQILQYNGSRWVNVNYPTIPSVGTWGALNYPTWTSGTPFVKMTSTGTFALDTNTYLTSNQSITLSGDVTGTGTTTITTSLATITQALSGSFVKVTLDTKGRVIGNTVVTTSDLTSLLSGSYVTSNLYTADGTLTSNRTISAGGYTLTINPTTIFNSLVTAVTNLAKGVSITSTLNTSAINDKLIALDISPTFTNTGAYIGVRNVALNIGSGNFYMYNPNTSSGTFATSQVAIASSSGAIGGFFMDLTGSFPNSGSRAAFGFCNTTNGNPGPWISTNGGTSPNMYINGYASINFYHFTGNSGVTFGGNTTASVLGRITTGSTYNGGIASVGASVYTGVILQAGVNSQLLASLYINDTFDDNGKTSVTHYGIYQNNTVPNILQGSTLIGGTGTPGQKMEIVGVNGAPSSLGGLADGILRLTGTGGSSSLDFGTSTVGYSWIQARYNQNYSSFIYNLYLQPASGNVTIGAISNDASAILNVVSTGKGVLLPRMTYAQRTGITSPTIGLLTYQTDISTTPEGFYINKSGGWDMFGTLGATQIWSGVNTFSATLTASGGSAKSLLLTPSLTSAANNDQLIAFDINPTFTTGANTGVFKTAINIRNGRLTINSPGNTSSPNYSGEGQLHIAPSTGSFGGFFVDATGLGSNMGNKQTFGFKKTLDGLGAVMFQLHAPNDYDNRLGILAGHVEIFGSNGTGLSVGGTTYTTPLGRFHSTGIYGTVNGLSPSFYSGATLTAVANNDKLIGLYINDTYNDVSFTGVTHYGIYQNNTAPNYLQGSTTFGAIVVLKGYTVATLPTGVIGATAYVTDALAPTFLVAVVGGGAVGCPVFYNGVSWIAY